jgi:transcription elongation GreA/GreB family factor
VVNINKEKLLEAFVKHFESELQLITEAAKNTYEIATHEENKPENEYDTRGLEASYLAGAQAERVTQMKETVAVLKSLKVKNFTDEDAIAFTALVKIENNKKSQWMFVLPLGGGVKIKFDNFDIQIVTPASPLGEALIGLTEGDAAVIDAGSATKEYEIQKVC